MAKTWNNTVPRGIEGTGAATIYGANPVAAQFGNQLSQFRERERQNELLKQQEAQRVAKVFRDNQLAASSGRLWADQVGKAEQEHLDKGIKLMQQGINPYESLDPRALDYQRERRNVQSLQGYRKAQEDQYNALIKSIQAKGVDKFEPEDIARLNQFASSGSLRDAYEGNYQLPQVRERFSPNTLLKDVRAITQNDVDVNGNIKSDRKFLDKKSTQEAIVGRLSSDPRGQQFLNTLTNGIPVQEMLNIPKTYEANKNEVIKEYEGNPQLRQQLARDGILGESSPKFNQWVDEVAKIRTQAKNNFDNQMDNFIASSAQGLQLWDRETPDYSARNQQRADERLNIAYKNLALREAEKKAEVSPEDYEVERIELRTSPTYKDGKEVSGSSKLAATLDKSVKVRSVAFPSTQIKSAFDVSIGKNVPLESKNDLKLARIGYTTVKGGGKELKAVVVDSDNNEYILDEREIPIDIRKGKAYGAARQALGSAPSVKPKEQSKIKIKGKDYDRSAVEQAAKSSDMTIEEYIKEANK